MKKSEFLQDDRQFDAVGTAEAAIESGGFLIRVGEEPNYDYYALREYAKKHKKKYCELSREELDQFHLPD